MIFNATDIFNIALNYLFFNATSLKKTIDYFRFLALTEKTLQQISFTEFLGCTLDICLVGYYVIMV